MDTVSHRAPAHSHRRRSAASGQASGFFFSLGLGNDAYWKINSPQTSDEDLDAIVDKIVSGLFSVSVTMGMCRICFHVVHRLTGR